MSNGKDFSLHSCTVQQSRAIISRIHSIFHFTTILTLLYYRISHLLHGDVPLLSWGLVTFSEVIFTLMWIISQPFRWQPVVRSVKPANLPVAEEFLGIDIFICTADPKKEPTVEVMNTLLSAMAIDYPPEKLGVYLSDDGGAAVTFYAMKEAYVFGKRWIPFVRKYGIKNICPEAYFSLLGDDERQFRDDEFREEEEMIKLSYQEFKRNVEKATALDDSARPDRPPYVEVIHDNKKNGASQDEKTTKLPLLVYVSRERRPSRPHRFKAGALNALLRVSGIMSNGRYIVVLDCDMYCNDPSSAKQAMCFHLDRNTSESLSYVQFPQIFYNVSNNDIYDGQARSSYKTKYQGMDGLGGTICAGTGYYLKKKALFCSPNDQDSLLVEAERKFGGSRMFIASLRALESDVKFYGEDNLVSSDEIVEEAKLLATCTFEENTQWGKDIGYSYACLLESSFTGYLLHCKGWKSVYLYPERPCFLGCTTIDMKDALVQLMKWASGLVQVGLSKFSPLTYGLSSRMPILQNLCYSYFMFSHFFSIPCLLYGIIPPLGFLTGISLFPQVTDPWFAPFAIVFISSLCQHLYEVLSSKGSIRTWWNEQRIFMVKSVTACLFGCLDVLLKWLGVAKASFRLTNKAVDEEKLKKYEKGRFDFEGAKMFMIPLTLLIIWNVICFIGGMYRMISQRSFEEMFAQAFVSSYVIVLSYPMLEGIISKKA